MTEENPDSRKCPQCGAPVPADAAHGLCPRCVFAKAMAATGGAPIEPPDIEAVRVAFPQFEVVSLIGTGGMGVVFKVRQPQLDRFVALKILAPERTDDSRFSERFQREAQALARLNHPSIVTIHDFGQAGGFYFLLMEFVDGVNLRQAMKAGRFTPEQALAIVPPVCEALQYAHEHGIVHRDIKPENLLLDKEGRVKIADFGIAKILGAESSGVGFSESQPVGTPQYMAPEQREHRTTDHRADIYSLGVVLYELLTGELPADQLQPPSRKVQIDVRLDGIVLRALEQTPELRYQTAGEMRTQVETIVQTPAGDKGSTAPSPSWRSISVKSPAMRGAWAGLLVFLLIVGGTAVVTSLLPRMYRSTALIQVSSEAISPLNTLPQIHSRTVLNQVAKELDLARQWVPRYAAEDLTEDGLYRLLRRKLDVRLQTGGTVFAVSYSSEDPDEAAQFANKVVEVFRAQPFGKGTLVLEAAEREARPIRPNKLLNMLLGLGAGIFLGVIVGMLVGFTSAWLLRKRGSTAAKVLVVLCSLALLLCLLVVGVVFVWMKIRRPEASRAGPGEPQTAIAELSEVKGQPRSNPATARKLVPPPASIPTHIEFKVLSVENPPGTRNIVMYFERDIKRGLGFDVTQNVMPSQTGQLPALGFRDGREKYWVGVNGPQTLSWVLPKEFTEVEIRAVAKQIELKWKGPHMIVEGARLEFGPAVHREGWQYILCANVLREPGSAEGVEPPKPAAFEVRLVVDTASSDSEQLAFIQQGTNGEKSPAERLDVQKKPLLDRSALKAADVQKNAVSGGSEIQLTFTEQGAKRFAEATRDHIGQRLAIVIAGKVYAAPKVMTEITGGKAVISGSFSDQEASDLAASLSESP